jgi:hypothetical protein
MTLFITLKRLVLVASAVFALLVVASCGQAAPVATVAPTPAIVATALPQAIQELAAPRPEGTHAPPVVQVEQPAPSDESAPCAPGQYKGNETSHIFHAPGQIAYAKTHAHVTCFDSAAQATAAGYRAAKR